MLHDKVKFKDLFDSERGAVVCYLSLERRYNALKKAYDLEVKSDAYNRGFNGKS